LKIGDVQGRQNRAHLGDTRGAADSFRRARALLLGVLNSNPDDVEAEEALRDANTRRKAMRRGGGNSDLN